MRFLDDYWDMAGLGDLDPNYMGMIDTIVASRGRVFGGTWFSTFSGYITRMRGKEEKVAFVYTKIVHLKTVYCILL